MILRIVIYTVLMFVSLMTLGGVSQAVGLPVELGLPQWGPAVAGLLMLVIFRKDNFRITFFNRETSLIRYLTALAIPLGAGLVVFVLSRLLVTPEAGFGIALDSPLLFLILIPIGSLGEEIGWRGYLHKRLDMKYRGVVSSLIVAAVWMPIHMQAFQYGPVVMLLMPLLILAYTVVIYAVVQDTGFSVLVATLFHMGINYSNMLYLDIIFQPALVAINAGVWLVLAAVTILTRRDLFFQRKADD